MISMASSAAIMAEINAKKREIQALSLYKVEVNKTASETNCLQNLLGSASSALKEVGSIGGAPLDFGKTEIFSTNVSKITANLEAILNQIQVEITKLEEEIEDLWVQYNAALAEEQEQARREEEEAKKTGKLKN